MLDTMKTVTTREFYHAPGLIKTLPAGQSLLVTDNGKASFTVTKTGKRPIKTVADLIRDAEEISSRTSPKVNFTAEIKKLKK